MAPTYLYNIETRSLESFSGEQRPAYAVLSHRWSKHELTFSDLRAGNFRRSPGLAKLKGTIQKAKRNNLNYVWLDTCCIDKDSSAELSKAINSMYQWYRDAKYCYVYLYDVNQRNPRKPFHKSNWFTRGWTLQELLAPSIVLFYDCKWRFLGDKQSLACEVSEVTGIAEAALKTHGLGRYSVAQKMSWAAKRETTVVEDRAYCLMGLFDVNMPLLYGEGDKAFLRLQEEIIKNDDDQSIFAWSMGKNDFSGLLAPTPDYFKDCGQIISHISLEKRQPFSMTNRGLSIVLQITPWAADTYLAYLDCAKQVKKGKRIDMGIFLRRLSEDDQYVRINLDNESLWWSINHSCHDKTTRPSRERRLFVRKNVNWSKEQSCLKRREYGFILASEHPEGCLVRPSLHECPHVLTPGQWGCVMVVDMHTAHESLSKIALGFDFDFHPVCLLLDSSVDTRQVCAEWTGQSDWSNVFSDDLNWDEISEGSRVHRSIGHDGMWALKGHRLRGFDVRLSEEFKDNRPLVRLRRVERADSLSAWILDVEGL